MIRLRQLDISNFRGICSASVSFSDLNFIVGNNGAGKTTALAAIARLLPIIRGERRLFLDSDFRFEGGIAREIHLRYSFDLRDSGGDIQRLVVSAMGRRIQEGDLRSNLNDQISGAVEVRFDGGVDQDKLRNTLASSVQTQRIIRSGWGGGRICPISLDGSDEKQRHAATSKQEEAGAFDGLRARLVESLAGTKIGHTVDAEFPKLKEKVLLFVNRLLGEERFVDIEAGFSQMLNVVRSDGCVHSWDSLSGGEQSALNLAMAVEFARTMNSGILLLEEPETNLHPTIQRAIIPEILSALPPCQLFIATHSPFVFDAHLDKATLLIASQDHRTGAELANPSSQAWLFSKPSWGELSYNAYGLANFEYHNELYGWIQERSQSWTEKKMETFLQTAGETTPKTWVREKAGKIQASKTTLMTFIRNFTHHPENNRNSAYTQTELEHSICLMMNIVERIRRGTL